MVLRAAQERRPGVVEELLDGSGESRGREGEQAFFPAAVLDDLAEFAEIFDIGGLDFVDGNDEASPRGAEGVGELGDLRAEGGFGGIALGPGRAASDGANGAARGLELRRRLVGMRLEQAGEVVSRETLQESAAGAFGDDQPAGTLSSSPV